MSTIGFTRVVVIAVLVGSTATASAQQGRTDGLTADVQVLQRFARGRTTGRYTDLARLIHLE